MQAIHYFPGGNTAEGFCSHFGDILPAPVQRRMFYLKGGPGVGKSTLMRRVGEAAEKAGLEVEYFHCSSDPDSLDAVCLPQKGAALMDGTAPHVYDPVAPGARDTLVGLGDFLDEAALRSHIEDILNLQKAISGRFRRCYCYLGGAQKVLEAARPGPVSYTHLDVYKRQPSTTLPSPSACAADHLRSLEKGTACRTAAPSSAANAWDSARTVEMCIRDSRKRNRCTRRAACCRG